MRLGDFCSWLNLIECFFGILSKQGLAHSVQHSKRRADLTN